MTPCRTQKSAGRGGGLGLWTPELEARSAIIPGRGCALERDRAEGAQVRGQGYGSDQNRSLAG